jgi:hypothetical protein
LITIPPVATSSRSRAQPGARPHPAGDSLPTIDHRGPEFGALGRRVLGGIQQVFQTAIRW